MGRSREPLPTRVEELPPLPPDFDSALDAGLSALGLTIDDAVRAAIAAHVRLMLAWTGAINLTAVRAPDEVARLHVVDSLTAVPLLRERGVSTLLDLGSGAGFPGVPLALALPAERALLVESVGKKARFLEVAVAAAEVAPRVGVANDRAEALARDPTQRERWTAVTARAVGALPELVELGLPLLVPGGYLVAWKRLPFDEEVAAAVPAVEALGGAGVEIVDPGAPMLPGHRLVVVRKERTTPTRFPRPVPERRRRPWSSAG